MTSARATEVAVADTETIARVSRAFDMMDLPKDEEGVEPTLPRSYAL
jgi:hypothetical protein